MSHGGNLRALALKAGCAPGEITDFSASITPLGPPEWLRQEIAASIADLVHYPDPESRDLLDAASARYGVPEADLVAANGTSEIIAMLPGLCGLRRAVVPVPAYIDYERSCRRAGLAVERLPLSAADGFALRAECLEAALAHGPALVLAGHPANPTGRRLDAAMLREAATRHPGSLFCVDEAFADFLGPSGHLGADRLVADRPDNVLVLLSLTKFYALPGLRLGLAAGAPALAALLRDALPDWSVNTLAQRVGARALADDAYARRVRSENRRLREKMTADLNALRDLRAPLCVHPGEANFLLLELGPDGPPARELAERLLVSHRLALRPCDDFSGLGERFLRVAVRTSDDNERLVQALAGELDAGAPAKRRRKRKVPAIMLQGTSSDAGKSVLAAALCRILLQDGLNPAPFKAQNMSNNSFVTADGLEMGRAQVTQAAACRRPPDARMNPVLLKPTTDVGSQVVLLGRPVGCMSVAEYVAFKPKALAAARQAYDDLADSAGVMVLEGAGSPAEVNLKAHDIVNMAMARHARAQVLLVADIDRGGSFASLMGTMDCLSEPERRLVAGLVLNRFRGDASLLGPALEYASRHTGKPFLGVVPHLDDLNLPEEDSVAFKAGRTMGRTGRRELDLVVADLPHISNFTDLDALALEPDVALRRVRSPDELGRPDAVILPGSRNTLADLHWLRETGLTDAVSRLRGECVVVGLCGGFQMLGESVADPERLESSRESLPGLGLLPLVTSMGRDKVLTRVSGTDVESGFDVFGYEIHHGRTTPLPGRESDVLTALMSDSGEPLGWQSADGLVLGTYLHGLFDADRFRRGFLDRLRSRKGLAALGGITARHDLEPALDRLADAVRSCLDMARIQALLGL